MNQNTYQNSCDTASLASSDIQLESREELIQRLLDQSLLTARCCDGCKGGH